MDNIEYPGSTIKRAWGEYKILDQPITPSGDQRKWKIKELRINPHQSTSYQVHHNRSEIWLVKHGKGTSIIGDYSEELYSGKVITINENEWHQIINGTESDLVIHEIQYGWDCNEEDIERQ